MKKWSTAVLFILCLAFGALALAEAADGTYSAEAMGRNGTLGLQMVIEGGAIASVEITQQQETEGVADAALSQLPQDIVRYQSIGVDTVTGATVTSEAILKAAAECIAKAGGNPEEWRKEVVKVAGEDIEMRCDVLVIGAGGAGMTAAATAAENGASVILIDKAAAVGGNTILCGGAFNAADPEVQKLEEMSESQTRELVSYLELDEADFGAFGETLGVLKGADPGLPGFRGALPV